jgi:hypothetical protein
MTKRVANPAVDPNHSNMVTVSEIYESKPVGGFETPVDTVVEDRLTTPTQEDLPPIPELPHKVVGEFPVRGDIVEVFVSGYNNWCPAIVVSSRDNVLDVVVFVPNSVPVIFKAGALPGDSANNWRVIKKD